MLSIEGVGSTTSNSPVDMPCPAVAAVDGSSSPSDSADSSAKESSSPVAGTVPLLGAALSAAPLGAAGALGERGPKISTASGKKRTAAQAAKVVPYSATYIVPCFCSGSSCLKKLVTRKKP